MAIKDKFEGLRDKLRDTHLHDAKVGAIHLKHRIGKLENLVNTNHRHDEPHEQRTDAKRTRIAEGHRFQSFAPERDGNLIKWYVDGRDYFHAVSVALEQAKETIYIEDWWLSPELFLRRPPIQNREWRLDRVLKRAAERGVKIYVIVYKEVEAAISCNSLHTKHALEALCPKGSPGYRNIVVMRHPDHNFFENAGDMTFYWAHHEKFIVIDYNMAFIGGLDLCFGRWDLRQHPLSDAHPNDIASEVWTGQDFNNNRIMDFKTVDDWKANELSKSEYGRMPWHDVAMGLIGPCIYDIAEHFVLRWNFVKRDKYKRDDRYDWLTLSGRTGDDEDLVGVQRPKHPVGDYIHHPLSPLQNKAGNPRQGHLVGSDGNVSDGDDEFHDAAETLDEHGYTSEQRHHFHGAGQKAREFAQEHHVRRPHPGDQPLEDVDKQENAKMTGNDPQKEGTVTASGGVAEKHGGYASHMPGAGKLADGYGTVHAQLVRSSADWSSGILTEQSIQNAYCQVIREAKHYVYIENQFFITATGDKQAPVHNLIGAAIVDACIAAHNEGRKFRVIVMLPTIPGFAGDLRDDAATGTRAIMDYQYKSICRGEESIYGRLKAAGVNPKKYVFFFNLRSYDRINKTPALKKIEEETGVKYQDLQREQAQEVMPENMSDDSDSSLNKKGTRHLAQIKKHRHRRESDNETAEGFHGSKRERFRQGRSKEHGPMTEDTIAKNAMLGERLPSQEAWPGRNGEGQKDDEKMKQQELENFIQEELYIHGKLLIVDDRVMICGSSNINDRSQLGFHDSELSIVMEDRTPMQSIMNGQEYVASRHAASLRRMLWREHLGLLPSQPLDASEDVNAQPPGYGENFFHEGDEYDRFVTDPLSDELWKEWTDRADTNTVVFRQLFHADPDDNVLTFDDYDRFLGAKGTRQAGHLYDSFQPVDNVREQLDKIKGHIVWMPLDFLEEANMAEWGLQVNSMTESVYT
ncbi:phospholipase D/nuclease [Piedraia hortae CBS 480.64]|uniref:Phospholipase n=1 Tax=Piedraia hortae CBS 480.64 TaxID=1314780 RepID=A0A6A7C3G7_9PEZI|nr:phospholipase D/nuclease [Piedraia hortae CBS 480.64]